jgi:hypothetical protein
MNWVVSILSAVIAAMVGSLLAGFVANACVTWYQIPSREGASGYFVVFIGLLGGIAGFAVGLTVSRFIAWNYGSNFGRELGGALGAVLLIAGVSALLCRVFADVPPKIGGRELTIEVEFRFPNTYSSEKPPAVEDDWQFLFASLSGNVRRTYREGTVKVHDARFEDGHWIVPASAPLFTERGRRSVTLAQRESTEAVGFVLPLPARPGPEFEHWSEWLPRHLPGGSPWPADKMSCRFRVQMVPAQPALHTSEDF